MCQQTSLSAAHYCLLEGSSFVPRAVILVTWRLDAGLFERVQAAARSRGVSVQAYASEALRRALADEPDVMSDPASVLTADHGWLAAEESRLSELEAYDWGPEGVPELEPVTFRPGAGFVAGH
jgi:hypothetical protein